MYFFILLSVAHSNSKQTYINSYYIAILGLKKWEIDMKIGKKLNTNCFAVRMEWVK